VSSELTQDTIAAIATPPGKGGVGIIRISGPTALLIGERLAQRSLSLRTAHFVDFKDSKNIAIDSGIILFFKAPHSFTGEDIVEIQGHGGPVIQDLLLKEVVRLGARQARAGEFSERAFLNDKIDLAQAEAIADLINSSTEQAARGAMRSLQGEFSKKIHDLLEELIRLRMYVEAAIDFPEEEIDFLADEKVHQSIESLQAALSRTIRQAGQGAILRSGLRLVIAGKPNAGKSSLLNALSGRDSAIVTNIPGTTRDVVSETIDLDGLPVHILDTAGLRESRDTVEKIGIERAKKAIDSADHVLLVVDINDRQTEIAEHFSGENTTIVYNKVDLMDQQNNKEGVCISATDGTGIDKLKEHIKQLAGYAIENETVFTARRRHLDALGRAERAVSLGMQQLKMHNAGELLADELRQAQQALNEITGEFSADDLLGEIFSGFCIGK